MAMPDSLVWWQVLLSVGAIAVVACFIAWLFTDLIHGGPAHRS
jgi:hypothetical protein